MRIEDLSIDIITTPFRFRWTVPLRNSNNSIIIQTFLFIYMRYWATDLSLKWTKLLNFLKIIKYQRIKIVER